MFNLTKKHLIIYSAIILVFVSHITSFALPAKYIKIRYSKSDGLVRIVLESNSYNLIRKSKVFTSYSLVKIAFHDYFVLEPEEIETPLFEFNHKGKNLYFNIKELKWIKLLRLDNPPRLVLDAIVEGKEAVPPKPPAPPEGKKKSEQERKPVTEKRTIVIDPGHGGKDLGIYNPSKSEKDIVLRIARKLRRSLSRNKYAKVVLTRSYNKDLGILKRIMIARKANPGLFISIHLTSSNSVKIYTALGRNPEGRESYLLSESQSKFIDESRRVAEAIGDSLKGVLDIEISYESLNIPVISSMNCPAVLVELPGPDFLDYNRKNIALISKAIEEAILTLWD